MWNHFSIAVYLNQAEDCEESDMRFQDLLNEYLDRLNCTGKELAAASGISPAVISRYRSGSHSPEPGSEQWRRLMDGLAALTEARGLTDLGKAELEQSFRACRKAEDAVDKERFRRNLNELLDAFAIGGNDLARYLNYDASYLSRIRSGQRMPRDAAEFAESVGFFIVRRCRSDAERELLRSLIGSSLASDARNEEYARAVVQYLCASDTAQSSGGIGTFLQKVDDFDLEEYIRVIHFDEMKTPSAPLQLPASRFYTGLKELMEAQLDFLKMTVLSRSDSPVTMYSDLPMSEMSQDPDFPKKWMFGIAMMLKKGLRLNMIHHVDRPFHEMMLGLESYIPMYMTGQISPYYLPGMQNNAFRHMLWVSGAAALQGDCITGHISDGRMYLTNRKADVNQYQKMAGQLLKRSSPLMDIYGQDRRAAFVQFLKTGEAETGARRSILSSLPIYTLSDDLARRILERNKIPSAERTAILNYLYSERKRTDAILEHSRIFDVLPEISEEEFSRYPMGLSLAGMFYSGDIRLSYEEYREYLTLCVGFANEHPGYSCTQDKDIPFRNIQITILENEWVIITKNKSPVIHFVIRHPKMRAAIENMVLPVIEP